MQVFLDLQTDDGKDGPYRKADGECHRAQGKRAFLMGGINV
jgi:hypothetical protein